MKITPVIRLHHKTKNGDYPITIRVTEGIKVRYYSVGYNVILEQWNKKIGRVTDKRTNHADINIKISSMLAEIEKNHINGNAPVPGNKDDFYFWTKRVSDNRESESTSSEKHTINKQHTFRLLKEFKDPLRVSDITYEFLLDFKKKLNNYRKKNGKPLAHNTIMHHFEAIRNVYLTALKSGIALHSEHAFTHFKISYKEGNRERLQSVHISKLASLNVRDVKVRSVADTKQIQIAVDMYLLSFYCGSLRFTDLCLLKKSNIEGDQLTFRWHKQDRPISKELGVEALEIVNRNLQNNSDYLFDIKIDWSTKKSIDNKNKIYNKWLRKACGAVGIPKVTMHTSKHSWADLAINNGVPLPAIMDNLGHKKLSTTQVYTKMFDKEKRNDALRKVSSLIKNPE